MVWCLFQNHYMRHEFKSKNRLDFIQRLTQFLCTAGKNRHSF